MVTKQSALQFAQWLKAKHPKLYHAAVAATDNQTAADRANGRGPNGRGPGLGQTETNGTTEKPWYKTFFESAATAGLTYLQYKNQRDVLDMNLRRAEAGLPPVDVETAPALHANVQVDADVADKISSSVGQSVQNIALWGGLALGAYLLLR